MGLGFSGLGFRVYPPNSSNKFGRGYEPELSGPVRHQRILFHLGSSRPGRREGLGGLGFRV